MKPESVRGWTLLMVGSPLYQLIILCKLNNLLGQVQAAHIKTNALVPTYKRDESMTDHTSWCHPHSAEPTEKRTGSALTVPIGRGGTCRGRFRPRSGAVFPRSGPYRSLTAQGGLSLSGWAGYSVALMAAGQYSVACYYSTPEGKKSRVRGINGSICAWD